MKRTNQWRADRWWLWTWVVVAFAAFGIAVTAGADNAGFAASAQVADREADYKHHDPYVCS